MTTTESDSKGVLVSTLPGTPPPTLEGVYGALTARQKVLLHDHLIGGTSAEWLSMALASDGHSVSASTIRTYRRSLKEVSA